MKECRVCKKLKSPTEFWWRNVKRGIQHTICKDCTLKYQRVHYSRSPKRRKKIADANRVVRERNYKWILEYLLGHPCIDCGEANPIVLDFDHNSTKTKLYVISNMVRLAYSLKRIQVEVQKCQVRCANCHRRRTAIQYNWKHRRVL